MISRPCCQHCGRQETEEVSYAFLVLIGSRVSRSVAPGTDSWQFHEKLLIGPLMPSSRALFLLHIRFVKKSQKKFVVFSPL